MKSHGQTPWTFHKQKSMEQDDVPTLAELRPQEEGVRHEAIVVNGYVIHGHVGYPVHGRYPHEDDPVEEDYSANEEHEGHGQSIHDIQHGVTLLVRVQKPSHVDKEGGGFSE